MDCKETRLRMDSLLAGDLTGEELRIISSHIKGCRECRKEYRLFQAVVQSMSDLPFYKPSAQFNANILAKLGMTPASIPMGFPVWAKWLTSGLLFLTSLWTVFIMFALRSDFGILALSRFMHWIKNAASILVSILMQIAETIGTVAGLLFQECAAIFNPLLLFQLLTALVIALTIVKVSICQGEYKWNTHIHESL